jgi:hypothetical protein
MDCPRIPRLANAGSLGQTLEQVLKQRCDHLIRENIMKQAASLKDFRVGMLLPADRINTSPADYCIVKICNYSAATRRPGRGETGVPAGVMRRACVHNVCN